MTQLLQNAAYGTALILAAALLRRALKDRLMPEARLALWAVCLFRLLTPAAPESVLSLWGLFRPRQTPAVSAPAPAPVAGTPQLYTPTQAGPSPAAPAIPWETVLFAVWLVVGGLLAARYVLSWIRTRRAVACAIPVKRDDPRYLPLPKCARLREGPMEGAPLTFGAVKPTVVLTPGLGGEALDCVLAHEGIHAKRRDNLWHYAMAVALVIYWWNPAVWLMSRLLRRDIELSCDRAAVKKLGAERRAEYANTLVSMATQESGPAFCQTFGRKAAEERILSVMKFKKTSVIGVVLSLALVLAITVAFASDPKAPAGTVEYHGQTYNRADLSQETLDWLDWYLTLPEEEQLAVSMVPPELIPDRAPDTYDSVKVNTSVTLDDITLPSDVVKYTSQLYAGMTRDEVHQLLGEPSFSSSSLYSDTYELDPDSHERQLSIYYEMDGTIIQVRYFSDGTDPDVPGINLTPFLTVAGEDQPNYVDPDKNVYDEYDVRLPTFDEDGNSVAADGGITGSTRYSLCLDADCGVTDPHAHINGEVVKVDYQDPYTGSTQPPSTIRVPSAPPEPAVPPAKSFDDYTIVGMDENGYPVDEQGNSLHFDENGNLFMKVRVGAGTCIKEDCPISEEHHHDNGEVFYHYNRYSAPPAPVPSAATSTHHSEDHHTDSHQ